MAVEWAVDVFLGLNLLEEWVAAPRGTNPQEVTWSATNPTYGTVGVEETSITSGWQWTEGGDALGHGVKVTAASTSSQTIGAVSPGVTLPRSAVGRNRLTEATASGEDGTVGTWVAVSSTCTVAASTAFASHGAYSIRGTSTVSGGASYMIHGAQASVVEGRDYTVVFDLRIPAGRTAYVAQRFYNGGSGVGSTATPTAIEGAPTGWQRYSSTATAPATATNTRILVGIAGASVQVGDVFYVDRAGIWEADGSTDWAAHSRPLSGMVYVRNDASYTGRSARASVRWLDADGATLATSTGPGASLSGTTVQWARVYASCPPAGAVAAAVVVEFLGSHTAAEAYWAWAAELCEGEQGIQWVELTEYVEWQYPLSIVRGRTDAQDTVQPGRLSGLTLDNRDGRFTVGNTAGPYGARWALGVPVMVYVRDDSYGYWECVFAGRVDGLPLRWSDNGNRCLVTLSASDVLADWVQGDWSRSESYLAWAYRTGVAYSPETMLAHWELTDVTPDGAVSTDGAYVLARDGLAPAESAGDAHPTDGRSSLRFPADGSGRFTGALPAGSGTGWWLSVWMRMTGPGTTDYGDELFLPIVVTGSSGEAVAIHPCSNGRLASTWITSGGTATDVDWTVGPWGEGLADGQWHLVTLAGTVDGSNTILGVGIDGGTSEYTSWGGTDDFALGGAPVSIAVGPYGGTADEFEVAHLMYGETSDAGPVESLQAYGLLEQRGLPASGQLAAAARFGRLPYPGSVDVPTGTSAECGPAPVTLRPIEVAQRIEATNYPGGVLYADRNGGLLFHPAADVYGTTVRTAVDSGDVTGVTLAVDRAGLVNQVTVTNVGRSDPRLAEAGLLQTSVRVEREVSDEGSVAGLRSVRAVEVTRYEERGASDARARSGVLDRVVQRLLDAEPLARVPEISLDAGTLPTAAERMTAATIDLFDWLDVTLPDGQRIPLRVEGVTHTGSVHGWSVRLTCSRAGFRLGDSTFGKLDGSTLLCR